MSPAVPVADQVDIPVIVCPGASLLLDVIDGDIRGRALPDEPFGNWSKPRTASDRAVPLLPEIESAVSKALGYPVRLAHCGAAEDLTLQFLFYRPALSDTEASLQEIREVAEEVEARKEKWQAGKEAAAALKGHYEEGCLELQAVIKRLTADEPPLFAHAKKEAEASPVDADAWRNVPLTEALQGLSPRTYEMLAEAGLTSMGHYADWCQAGKMLLDIPGIGQAKLEQIQEAEVAFWARHNASAPPESTANATP